MHTYSSRLPYYSKGEGTATVKLASSGGIGQRGNITMVSLIFYFGYNVLMDFGSS